jgi:hypothetical protein
MRRLRVLLVGTVAVGALVVGAGVGYADAPSAGNFCDQIEEFADDFESIDLEDIDITDPDSIEEAFEGAADAYGELADNAPKKVKKAFNTIANYYEDLAEEGFDIENPESFDDLVPSGKVAKAFTKVGNFLADECGVDLTGTDV